MQLVVQQRAVPYRHGLTLLRTLLAPAWLACAAHGQIDLGLRLTYPSDVPVVETSVQPGHLLLLEHSDNLRDWTETARALEHLHPYADALRGHQPLAFYRVRASPLQPPDDWSNLIEGSSQKLFLPGSGSGLAGTSIVKWSILLNHPDRVYFQDSVRYPYHIQFARARLPGYAAISTLDYYAQALYATSSQRMVLGSVLRAPNPLVRELGIEITGTEAFPATKAIHWIEAVKHRLVLEPGWRVYYMPATEQRAETEANLALFAARGLEIASLNRWTTVNSGYEEYYPSNTTYELDFEFKRIVPGQVGLKQIRAVPHPTPVPPPTIP